MDLLWLCAPLAALAPLLAAAVRLRWNDTAIF